MGEGNSYLEIARKDLKYAKIMLQNNEYNPAGRFSQQAVEKYFKHLIEALNQADYIGYMKLHTLPKLYKILIDNNVIEYKKETRDYLSTLTRYYFDTNYPGEEYQELSKIEAEEAVEFAGSIIDKDTLLEELS